MNNNNNTSYKVDGRKLGLAYSIIGMLLDMTLVSNNANAQIGSRVIIKEGSEVDFDKPIAPQLEATLLNEKANMTQIEWEAFTAELNSNLNKALDGCLNPLVGSMLHRVCDQGITLQAILCETDIAKEVISECKNPIGIQQYLTQRGITNPEEHLRYTVDKYDSMREGNNTN